MAEKGGDRPVEKGQHASGSKTKKSASKKDMRVIEASPAAAESSRKAARRQKKALKKQLEMEELEKAMEILVRKKEALQGKGQQKDKNAAPSPRESNKGNPSKRAVDPKPQMKGTQVRQSKGGSRKKSDSVDSSNPSGKPAESNVISDLHSIGLFDNVKDVPPCEVNSEGAPIGEFWKHMRSYTHGRAPWLFEWDIPWTQQPKELKRNFANRVRTLYPGKYDIDFVMEDVATNIRQRRQRCRNHMIKNGCKNYTPIAHGLTQKSWKNIWASLSNPHYQDKSNKCKIAADARTERMGYTHRLGPLGVAGLIIFFEKEFHRIPTHEEVQVGKREGVRGLFEIIRNRYNKKPGPQVVPTVKLPSDKGKKKVAEVEPSRDSDEESARTSSDEEEDNDNQAKRSGSSSSSGSGTSNTTGSEESDGEGTEVEGNNIGSADDFVEEDDGDSSDAATSDHDE